MILQKETLLALVLAVICLTGLLVFGKSESTSNQLIESENIEALPKIPDLNQESDSEIIQLSQQKPSLILQTETLNLGQLEPTKQQEQKIIPASLNFNLTLPNPLGSRLIKQSKKAVEKNIEEQNILSILLLSPSGDCYRQGEQTEIIGPVAKVSVCCCCGPECPPSCCAMCGWCNGKKAAYIWDPQTGLCGCEH